MTDDWMNQAACRSPGLTHLFFPTKEEGAQAVAEARKICAECPVLIACRSYAATAVVDTGWGSTPVRGVWGGLTLAERTAA